MKDVVIHRLLKKPYLLNYNIYQEGNVPVVFLHGINSSINNWKHVMPYLGHQIQPILIDLVGFGESAKPKWPNYDINFHTKQIEYTIKKLGINKKITLVGHSMGGLIALQLVKNKPELYNQLILVNTPLYATEQISEELARSKKSKLQATNILFAIYEKLLQDKDLTLKRVTKIIKYLPNDNAFSLSEETWLSFEKSLKNTIMKQNSLSIINQINIPIYFMNGITDVLTITKNQVKLSAKNNNIELDLLPTGHMINKISGKKIASKINNTTL